MFGENFYVRKMNPTNELMTYGKTKGIVLLKKYLPELNPFTRVKIIRDLNEWNAAKDTYPDRILTRTDTKIGDPRNVRITGTSGKKEDIPGYLKEVKEQNPDGVLILLDSNAKVTTRYECDGGFNVAFFERDSVVIELVGKGYEASTLTRDKGAHERYVIPWDNVLFLRDKKDLMRDREVSKYVIDDESYQKSRKERVTWLKSIEDNHEEIEKAVPTTYIPFKDSFITDLLNKVVVPLYMRKDELKRDGVSTFNVQGNIVDGKIVPWEIFRPERLNPRCIENER